MITKQENEGWLITVGPDVVAAATITLPVVGKRSDTPNYYNGQIKSVKFIDKSGSTDVIETYILNSNQIK